MNENVVTLGGEKAKRWKLSIRDLILFSVGICVASSILAVAMRMTDDYPPDGIIKYGLFKCAFIISGTAFGAIIGRFIHNTIGWRIGAWAGMMIGWMLSWLIA